MRHTTFYLACGGESRPPIVFVHGFPELSIGWLHQRPVVADMLELLDVLGHDRAVSAVTTGA